VLGTYGCPKIPPPDATVLPAVVVLKLVLNQLKQAAAHKIRICVHGGMQIQGKDFDESYAHTSILSHSLKIIVAVACCLDWLLYHFDIRNAFQSTPDTGDIHGNRSWLQSAPYGLTTFAIANLNGGRKYNPSLPSIQLMN
jgi:hypothetical protein